MVDEAPVRLIDEPSPSHVESASWIWHEAEYLRVGFGPYESYLEDQRSGFVDAVSRKDWWLTVAVRRSDVVGLVGGLRPAIGSRAAYVGYIAVAARTRRQGIGRALIDRAVARAAALGASRMLLTVHETNNHARRLYEQAGWSPTGRLERTPIDHEPLVEYSHDLTPT